MPLDIDFLMGEGVEVEEDVTMSKDWTKREFLEILECLENQIGYPCSRALMKSPVILGYDFGQRSLYKELILGSVPPGSTCDFPPNYYASIEALRECIEERSTDLVA